MLNFSIRKFKARARKRAQRVGVPAQSLGSVTHQALRGMATWSPSTALLNSMVLLSKHLTGQVSLRIALGLLSTARNAPALTLFLISLIFIESPWARLHSCSWSGLSHPVLHHPPTSAHLPSPSPLFPSLPQSPPLSLSLELVFIFFSFALTL